MPIPAQFDFIESDVSIRKTMRPGSRRDMALSYTFGVPSTFRAPNRATRLGVCGCWVGESGSHDGDGPGIAGQPVPGIAARAALEREALVDGLRPQLEAGTLRALNDLPYVRASRARFAQSNLHWRQWFRLSGACLGILLGCGWSGLSIGGIGTACDTAGCGFVPWGRSGRAAW